MATGNYLTVRDYFDQVLFGNTAKREAISSVKAEASGGDSFYRILTAYGNRRFDRDGLKPTGLTVVDYLKNPVRVKCQFDHRLSSTAPANKETKNDSPPGLPQSMPAGQSTDMNRAAPGLQNAPQAGSDLSGPICPNNQTVSNESLKIERSIHKAARRYGLPPGLLKGVIRAESNFEVNAVSRAGAQGLMQLMPATAKALGVEDPFDIEQNIDGGARYLRQMLDSFGGNVKVALAAYNAGPGAVERYGGQIPPYQETAHYINRVLQFSKQMA